MIACYLDSYKLFPKYLNLNGVVLTYLESRWLKDSSSLNDQCGYVEKMRETERKKEKEE